MKVQANGTLKKLVKIFSSTVTRAMGFSENIFPITLYMRMIIHRSQILGVYTVTKGVSDAAFRLSLAIPVSMRPPLTTI